MGARIGDTCTDAGFGGFGRGASQAPAQGWVSRVWNGSTVMAFLGLTVGRPLWSVAMFGFVLSIAVATGRRARKLAGVEPLVALASLLIMGSGLVWLGLIVAHEPEPSGWA